MKKNSNRSHRNDAHNLLVFSDISARSAKKRKQIKDIKNGGGDKWQMKK